MQFGMTAWRFRTVAAHQLLKASLRPSLQVCQRQAGSKRRPNMPIKNKVCLWYNGDALDAAEFYADTFPDTTVGTVHHAPGDYPAGKENDVLMVEFTVMGIPCIGLNGGPAFSHNDECLRRHLYGWSSIRANRQYSLVFPWTSGTVGNQY